MQLLTVGSYNNLSHLHPQTNIALFKAGGARSVNYLNYGATWTGYHGEWRYLVPMRELALLFHFKGNRNHHLNRLIQAEPGCFWTRLQGAPCRDADREPVLEVAA